MQNQLKIYLLRIVVCLIFAVFLVSFTGCKKDFYELFAESVAPDFEANNERSPGIPCSSEATDLTFQDGRLTYDVDHVLCVEIDMIPEDLEAMRYESRFGPDVKQSSTVIAAFMEYWTQCDVPWPSHYNWYMADISIDGIAIDRVGIRKKGFLGSIFSFAPSMKIQTSRIIPGQSFNKTHKVTLNNNAEDPSRLRSLFNSYFFERVGYPAPRSNLANVRVNDEHLGIYTHLEPIDEEFLLRVFGNNHGDLYEGQLAEFRTDWIRRWAPKTDQTEKGYTRLKNFARMMETATDEEFANEINLYLNVDRFVQYWALEVLLEHHDGFTSNRNNFFLYLDPADSYKATFIPWGFNYYFGENSEAQAFQNYIRADLSRRLSRVPEIREKFNVELRRLIDDEWNEAALKTFIEEHVMQVLAAQSNPDYDRFIDDILQWIDNRRSVIEQNLVNGLPIGEENGATSCLGL